MVNGFTCTDKEKEEWFDGSYVKRAPKHYFEKFKCPSCELERIKTIIKKYKKEFEKNENLINFLNEDN